MGVGLRTPPFPLQIKPTCCANHSNRCFWPTAHPPLYGPLGTGSVGPYISNIYSLPYLLTEKIGYNKSERTQKVTVTIEKTKREVMQEERIKYCIRKENRTGKVESK